MVTTPRYAEWPARPASKLASLLLSAAPGQMYRRPGQGAVGDTEQDVVAGFAPRRRVNAGTVQQVLRR